MIENKDKILESKLMKKKINTLYKLVIKIYKDIKTSDVSEFIAPWEICFDKNKYSIIFNYDFENGKLIHKSYTLCSDDEIIISTYIIADLIEAIKKIKSKEKGEKQQMANVKSSTKKVATKKTATKKVAAKKVAAKKSVKVAKKVAKKKTAKCK
jgi:hypothetical protein